MLGAQSLLQNLRGHELKLRKTRLWQGLWESHSPALILKFLSLKKRVYIIHILSAACVNVICKLIRNVRDDEFKL